MFGRTHAPSERAVAIRINTLPTAFSTRLPPSLRCSPSLFSHSERSTVAIRTPRCLKSAHSTVPASAHLQRLALASLTHLGHDDGRSRSSGVHALEARSERLLAYRPHSLHVAFPSLSRLHASPPDPPMYGSHRLDPALQQHSHRLFLHQPRSCSSQTTSLTPVGIRKAASRSTSCACPSCPSASMLAAHSKARHVGRRHRPVRPQSATFKPPVLKLKPYVQAPAAYFATRTKCQHVAGAALHALRRHLQQPVELHVRGPRRP